MELKFKAKCLTSNEWVFGDGFQRLTEETSLITKLGIKGAPIPVLHDSITLFTGYFDKNGNEIYIGDFLEHDYTDNIYQVLFEEIEHLPPSKYSVYRPYRTMSIFLKTLNGQEIILNNQTSNSYVVLEKVFNSEDAIKISRKNKNLMKAKEINKKIKELSEELNGLENELGE